MNQPQLIVREIPIHPALPEDMRRRLAGRHISITLPRPVRMRLRQPEKISVSECAAKYRQVTGIDARPGPWRNDLMPHAVFPMDLFQKPWVREIWLCWPERTAKTNVMLNCLAAVARLFPGNVFWLEPADDDAGNNVKTKIIPMFRQSPGLKKYLSPRADDTGKKLIAFSHGMHLFPASANSARTMANFFGKYNFGNEVDKYPAMVGTETDPIKLIRKRGRDVRGSKYMFGSTPAGRYIYKGTMSCRQVWQYRNRCPHCEELVLMDDEHLDIPTDSTPEQVENGDVAVGYSCNACGSVWTDYDRERSFYLGQWHCIKGAGDPRPGSIGLHASALPFPMIPLPEYCGKYLRSKTGDLADKVDFAHGYQVIDYDGAAQEQRQEDQILRLVDEEMPRGVVPRETSTLIALADTQQVGFMYQIVAFEWGNRLRSHLVDHGYVENFEDLAALGAQDWLDADGKIYRCQAGFIDSGGGTNPFRPKHTRTVEVYDFCRLNRLWRPLKGQRRDNATPWEIKRQDYYPTKDGKKKPIPGGLKRYNIDVTLYKNRLADKLNLEPNTAGSISLHAGLYDGGPHSGVKYAAQLCAEVQDDRGYWECAKNKANHFWDTWVYAFAAADILGVVRKKRPTASAQPPVEEKQARRNQVADGPGRSRPSWRS